MGVTVPAVIEQTYREMRKRKGWDRASMYYHGPDQTWYFRANDNRRVAVLVAEAELAWGGGNPGTVEAFCVVLDRSAAPPPPGPEEEWVEQQAADQAIDPVDALDAGVPGLANVEDLSPEEILMGIKASLHGLIGMTEGITALGTVSIHLKHALRAIPQSLEE